MCKYLIAWMVRYKLSTKYSARVAWSMLSNISQCKGKLLMKFVGQQPFLWRIQPIMTDWFGAAKWLYPHKPLAMRKVIVLSHDLELVACSICSNVLTFISSRKNMNKSVLLSPSWHFNENVHSRPFICFLDDLYLESRCREEWPWWRQRWWIFR